MKYYVDCNPQVSGWYNASLRPCKRAYQHVWRFFDVDKGWSVPYWKEYTVGEVLRFTAYPNIFWNMYWPKNARVEDTRTMDDSKLKPENIINVTFEKDFGYAIQTATPTS